MEVGLGKDGSGVGASRMGFDPIRMKARSKHRYEIFVSEMNGMKS